MVLDTTATVTRQSAGAEQGLGTYARAITKKQPYVLSVFGG